MPVVVQTVQKPMEVPQLQYIDKVVDIHRVSPGTILLAVSRTAVWNASLKAEAL